MSVPICINIVKFKKFSKRHIYQKRQYQACKLVRRLQPCQTHYRHQVYSVQMRRKQSWWIKDISNNSTDFRKEEESSSSWVRCLLGKVPSCCEELTDWKSPAKSASALSIPTIADIRKNAFQPTTSKSSPNFWQFKTHLTVYFGIH